MTTLTEQIISAVNIALNSNPLTLQLNRLEAHNFLNQVKLANNQTWLECWSIFYNKQPRSRPPNEVRLFACQVVGESIPTLSREALTFLQTSLFEYFTSEYVQGSAENKVAFIKNASLRLATLVFVQVYPLSTPHFLTTFISLLRQYPAAIEPSLASSSPRPLNPQTTDLLLRLLHEVATEISDAQLRLNKPGAKLAQDAILRDAVRERDAPSIAAAIWDIVGEALDGLNSPDLLRGEAKVGLKGNTAKEMAEMSIRVIGDYVSWIDINLMVTPTSIPLLLRALHLPSPTYTTIRIATVDALHDTITKGMPSNEKIALLTVLDLGTVLHQLGDIGRTTSNRRRSDNETELLREKIAKLLNGLGGELCKVCEDTTASPEASKSAMSMATSLLPLLLRFLSDINDDTAAAVFPFANAILSVYKKEKKRSSSAAAAATADQLTETRRAFLTELLRVAFQRMEYAADYEWTMSAEGEEDDAELAFADMRRNLKVILDAVALIDPELYSEAARSIVIATLDAYSAGGATAASLSWQRVELALHLIYGYVAVAAGPGAFVQVPPAEIARSKKEVDYHINYTSFPLSPMGDMMLRVCRSKVIAYRHPAVSLQLFEIVVRYHDFFKLCPEYIVEILPCFLDQHGLHQTEEVVQARVFYLFNRFIYSAKSILQAQVSGELIETILSQMQDLLVVKADFPPIDVLNNDSLLKAASAVTPFTAQLYLFETVGTLISILNQVPAQQVVLLRAALAPLLSSIQANVRPSATSLPDFIAVLQVHHLILAIGNVGKGFPDLSTRVPIAVGSWVAVMKEATEGILTVAKTMSRFIVIREAARFAFNRIVSTTGEVVLPLIPTLIDCLIGEVTLIELGDLLNFLGLLAAKYKTSFLAILDALLLPVFNQVFSFLKLPIMGTDDTVEHSTLRRAYFTFILSIASANLQEVFYSEKNKGNLQDILQSITHYIANDALAADQKYGFLVLNRFASQWLTYHASITPPVSPPVLTTTTNGIAPTVSPVPGFEQFLYGNAVKLCFQIPLEGKFDYSDATSYQVIGEISNFLKLLLARRGSEFGQFMMDTLFPSIECPPPQAQTFMENLQAAADGKVFKKFLSEWLRLSRGAPPI